MQESGLLNQLYENGMISSMSRKGNCYDKAAIESFWSTLEHELISDAPLEQEMKLKQRFLITSRASIT
jgi:transposase InsO family protein